MKILITGMLFVVMTFVFSCMSISVETVSTSFPDENPPPKAGDVIKNQEIIDIDIIVFDMMDMLRIHFRGGQDIAKYQRILNPNYSVYSAKVFSFDGTEKCIIVPKVDQAGTHYYFKDNQGKQASVDMTVVPHLNGFGSILAKYSITTGYFKPDFVLHIFEKSVMTTGFSIDIKTDAQFLLYFRNTPVLAYVVHSDLSNPKNDSAYIVADRNFVHDNENDAAAWCVLFVLIRETNAQLAAENNRHQSRNTDPWNTTQPWITPIPRTRDPLEDLPQRKWNNDGTPDNNHNPFDRF